MVRTSERCIRGRSRRSKTCVEIKTSAPYYFEFLFRIRQLPAERGHFDGLIFYSSANINRSRSAMSSGEYVRLNRPIYLYLYCCLISLSGLNQPFIHQIGLEMRRHIMPETSLLQRKKSKLPLIGIAWCSCKDRIYKGAV